MAKKISQIFSKNTTDGVIDGASFISDALDAAIEESKEEDISTEEVIDDKKTSKKEKKQKSKDFFVEKDFYVKRRLVSVLYKRGQKIEEEDLEFLKSIGAPLIEG